VIDTSQAIWQNVITGADPFGPTKTPKKKHPHIPAIISREGGNGIAPQCGHAWPVSQMTFWQLGHKPDWGVTDSF